MIAQETDCHVYGYEWFKKFETSLTYSFDADLKTPARYVYVRMKTAYPNVVF